MSGRMSTWLIYWCVQRYEGGLPRMTTSSGPLAGVRVLDLTAVVMGPLATQILGDLGADVITVEHRHGDINRTMTRGLVRGLSGVSMNLLRNKRNITLDVAHPLGRRALLRIAQTCDVFVTNLLPSPLQRLPLQSPNTLPVRPPLTYLPPHPSP